MTYRDTSADITLDNASMKNEFNVWANREGFIDAIARNFAGCGWNARQPEIDALKAELNEVKGVWLALKRENERLRKDAERWIWARLHPDHVERICMIREWRGSKYVSWRPKPEYIDSMIDAAMKDFSTQPKEE